MGNYESTNNNHEVHFNNQIIINDDNIREYIDVYIRNKASLPPEMRIINNWDVSQVTDMSGLFANKTNFNEDIGNWDVSHVTDMSRMFSNATNFNKFIGNWNVSEVGDMSEMFANATLFNNGNTSPTQLSDPLRWNVANVSDMTAMFAGARSFNSPLEFSNIEPSIPMSFMFDFATNFNQPLNHLNIRTPIDHLQDTFNHAIHFRQPINNWVVTDVDRDMDIHEVYLLIYGEDTGDGMLDERIDEMIELNLVPTILGNDHVPVNRDNNNDGIEHRNVAMEVHREFNKYSSQQLINLVKVLSTILQKPETFYSNMPDKKFWDYIFDKFVIYISEYMSKTSHLEAILSIINKIKSFEYSISPTFKELIGLCVDYTFGQPDFFINEYINQYLADTVQAYGCARSLSDPNYVVNNTNISCVGGIHERFVLVFENILKQMCYMGETKTCKSEYEYILQHSFGLINFSEFATLVNDVSKQWNDEHLENDEYKMSKGWSENNSVSEIKEDFINYVSNECKIRINNYLNLALRSLPEYLLQHIRETADKFEEEGIFSRMYFGGVKLKKYKRIRLKKYTKKNKTHTKKNNKNKNNKNKKTISNNWKKNNRKKTISNNRRKGKNAVY